MKSTSISVNIQVLWMILLLGIYNVSCVTQNEVPPSPDEVVTNEPAAEQSSVDKEQGAQADPQKEEVEQQGEEADNSSQEATDLQENDTQEMTEAESAESDESIDNKDEAKVINLNDMQEQGLEDEAIADDMDSMTESDEQMATQQSFEDPLSIVRSEEVEENDLVVEQEGKDDALSPLKGEQEALSQSVEQEKSPNLLTNNAPQQHGPQSVVNEQTVALKADQGEEKEVNLPVSQPTSAPVAPSGLRAWYVKNSNSALFNQPNGQQIGVLDKGDPILVSVNGDWAEVKGKGWILVQSISKAPVGRVRQGASWK